MRIVAAARDALLLAALATRFEVTAARSSWHAVRLLRDGTALAVIGPPYGVDLVRAIRRDKQHAAVVCILNRIEDAEAALNAGATMVVTPPLQVQYVVDVIEAWTHDDG